MRLQIGRVHHDGLLLRALRRQSNFRSVGEVDFVALFRRLVTLGYIPPDAKPDIPDPRSQAAMVADFADQRTDGLRPLPLQ